MKTKYVCDDCGSEDIDFDAFARWDVDEQEMVLSTTFDESYCSDCGGTNITEVEID